MLDFVVEGHPATSQSLALSSQERGSDYAGYGGAAQSAMVERAPKPLEAGGPWGAYPEVADRLLKSVPPSEKFANRYALAHQTWWPHPHVELAAQLFKTPHT